MVLLPALIASVAAVLALISLYLGHRTTRQYRDDRAKLYAIADLEVHGGEFVDAAELYKILAAPIPAPVDHAANIRARAGAPPYRSPYT